MDARREGKLRKKAPTEYETTPVFFSGSNPDASTKFGTIFEILKIIGEWARLVEQNTVNVEDVGSNPTLPARKAPKEIASP